MTQSATKNKEDDREEGLKDDWGQLASAIDWELRGVTDRFWDGWPDERLMGRREGPAYGWTQTLPPRIAGQCGEVDPYMHAPVWARNRLTELMHLARGKAGGIGGVGTHDGGAAKAVAPSHLEVRIKRVTADPDDCEGGKMEAHCGFRKKSQEQA